MPLWITPHTSQEQRAIVGGNPGGAPAIRGGRDAFVMAARVLICRRAVKLPAEAPTLLFTLLAETRRSRCAGKGAKGSQTHGIRASRHGTDRDPDRRRRSDAATGAGRADRRQGTGRFAARMCESPDEALAAARAGTIFIADIETIGGVGHFAEFTRGATPLIATSARGSLNAAVAAVKAGAVDFLAKPIGATQLMEQLEAAVSTWHSPAAALPAPARPPRDETFVDPGKSFAGFVGTSAPMRAVYAQIRQIARSRAPVFITGDSGTGKELCAEAIHVPARAAGPFVAINCGAIPKDLMEIGDLRASEGGLHRRHFRPRGGCPPGARRHVVPRRDRELDLGLQTKLLRFLQTGSSGASVDRHREGRHPRSVRHQPLTRRGGASGAVSRGPVLSPARGADPPADAERARR